MTRRLFSLLLVSSAMALYADDKPAVKLDGTVSYYKPGQWIAIVIRPQVEKTYNLADKDNTYVLDPDLRVGSKVNMEESKDSSGHTTVSIHLKR